MYLKIHSDKLIVKISQEEAQTLFQQGKLNSKSILSSGFTLETLIYANDKAAAFSTSTDLPKQTLVINIFKDELESELNSRPSKSGILVSQSDDLLNVYLQVDLKKRQTH